ncbi:MAG TPA: SAM-dependent methyltransferase [Nitrospiraceae bacterium]|nr:SAM-dependent methyltransferase [Nitrospiraceae bacterium]
MLGHPNLVADIVREIQVSGPISFARFMELALYHPAFGYYMRFSDKPDAEQPAGGLGEDRIGWSGDYYTSCDVSPILANCVAKQIVQMDALLGQPDPFTVVEMGAGKGVFARDVLTACRTLSDSVATRLHYVLIERSPMMQASQQQLLAPWNGEQSCVAWMGSLAELPTEHIEGVLLSNELVDAFPVHRIRVADGEPREVWVDYVDGRLCERLQPCSTLELQNYLQRLDAHNVVLAEGACADINVQAIPWMKDVARVLRRGFVMTIDYGHLAHDLYGPERKKGTLLCYYHQMASEDPYQLVGLQDMTAHVDFSTLAAVGEGEGLHVTGFTNQMSFLTSLGVERMLESLEPGSAEFQSVLQLLRPNGMGSTFKVLIQHKGLGKPDLDGLRFKPFFASALATSADGLTV